MSNIPTAPIPKTRSKSRYSMVIMSESGSARQIELTPNRIRAAIVAAIVLISVTTLGFIGFSGLMSGDQRLVKERDELAQRVRGLEEEIAKHQLARTFQAKRREEIEQDDASARVPPAQEPTRRAPGGGIPAASQRAGVPREPIDASGSRPEAATTEPRTRPKPDTRQTVLPRPTAPRESGMSPDERPPTSPSSRPPGSEEPSTALAAGIINFDAKSLSALVEGSGRGKIKFRLIKDQPDVRFLGYLFVIVELLDSQGNYKLVCYPAGARLGPEDLPENYRDGANLDFTSNVEVDMPYKDPRIASSLKRVSILVYREDGNVVFQRGFDRAEMKFRSTKAAGRTPERPAAKQTRHAL